MRRLFVFLGFAALLVSGPAVAGEVKTLDIFKGAQVWLAEDHSVPVIALTASLPAGSAYDLSTKPGTGALAAALLTEGAGKLGGTAFQSALADHNIRLDVKPGRDYLTVSLLVAPADAKEAFRLLGQALSHPRFDTDAVERIRAQMLQDLDRDKEDASAVARDSLYSLYFGTHPYGHPIGGDKRGLAGVTRADLTLFARRHWVRGGLKIAIAGDIDAGSATKFIRTAFGALPAEEPPQPAAPVFVGAPGLHVIAMNTATPDAIFALAGLKRDDPDYLAGLAVCTILGGGASSRLGTGVSTGLIVYRRAGLLTGELGASREDMRRAIDRLRDALRKFAADGPNAQEYADAKFYLGGSLPLSLVSNEDIAAKLAALQQEGVPADTLQKLGDRIVALGIDDVRRAARRLLDPAQMTVVVAGSLPQEKRTKTGD